MVTGSTIAVVFALFGVVTTVLWLTLAALGLVKMDQIRRTLEDAGVGDRDSDPVETLRSRYAEGELTDEQFERKLGGLLETEETAGTSREPAVERE